MQDPLYPSDAARIVPINESFFEPGRNCECVRHANRFTLLIDGADYFRVLREAITRAERTVFILGWDIDSRMKLTPEGSNDGLPEALGDFLHAVAAKKHLLRVYILAWDFAMLYAFEREWLPVFKMGWRTHRRIAFQMDGKHPLGGSHHQKIVVVDDCLAFVGGLDLTRSRWDTQQHQADDPLRRDANGARYQPCHDVHSMFDGEAAREIGMLARERWARACKSKPAIRAQPVPPTQDPWPPSRGIDLENVDIAISLTEPAYMGRDSKQQIRTQYLDAIARARRSIYIENQYFTSAPIGAALSESLARENGPELTIVVPRNQTGWLQKVTMGVLRARLHGMLKEADKYGRYRLLSPDVPGLGESIVNVHSKLMIVDDELLIVGSANLNNRSMVLDSECNVSIDAGADARIRRAIAKMRDTLLAEHLGCEVADFVRERDARGSVTAAIRALQRDRDEHRTLVDLDPQVSPELDRLIPPDALIDPETPIAANELIDQFVPAEKARPLIGRYALLGVLALLVVGFAAAWHWSPLAGYLNLKSLANAARQIEALPLAPLWIVLAYIAAAVVCAPVTLLIATMGVVFGAASGGLYAFIGTTVAAATSFWIGNRLGRDAVRKLAGARVNRLSERVAKRGIVAVAVLRLLPVAPFAIVNLVAGASHVRMRDFIIGTMLGMGPGIFLTVAFAHQLVASLRRPTAGSFAVLIGIGAVLIGLSVLLQRFLGRSGRSDPHEGAPSDDDKPRASDEAERAQRLRDHSGMPRDASGKTSTQCQDEAS
ncbi:phosphatidylserine/phosphatidylglycerophosphate/cardiolipin synthase-like enzyme/membrane protein DedA with SNARE-associated domain [Paraburkholderia sp. JPY158]|uniref:Phosphatidylserine/phosphatidylglycerophosphate/ cardiolipin synthase-like enzyme/membrane protein DedA with SNARE-associated domain n=1 Tax=Paraburkholderia atlantica TaxID=2654982 RepID=A0A7W8Q5E8_PARAM|nr:VTT domain-containing protein [Paraburkholderia atlantica]MBB5424102.1 phosphatidylserine/phosphatidylglycerophosphate/cardiolipin synthase-like enzyme/membrane protein DedA with SNARE-associated domain [Paraburkholderia atlantica]